MAGETSSSRRWNLFARELEDVLATPLHRLRLSQLDDRAGIHPEKVRRLRYSLERPKSFPTLNPEEMALIVAALGLSDEEVLRLRAAILATAVEALLMDRITPEDALMAAEQILPVLREALRQHADEQAGIGAFRRREGIGPMTTMDNESALDAALEEALAALDRATLALHLSYHVESLAERIERARQAHSGYTATLDELDAAEAAIRSTTAWQEWRAEALTGRQVAVERLADLGA